MSDFIENQRLEREAQEYFSHNPKAKEVGFVMLDSDKLKAIRNDDSIYLDEDDIFFTVENDVELK